MKRFAFVLLLCAASLGSTKVLGQNCSYVLEMYHELAFPQTASQSVQLSGDLNSVTFNLYFEGTGLSYPADMMVYLYAPNGQCIVWGGWDVIPTGTCQNVGTGFANSWPGNWSTTVNGNYTYTLNTDDFGLNGSGEWTVTIQNAWQGGATALYDLDLVFGGICEGDCFDPDACNFVPDATYINNDVCIYPTELGECNDETACNYVESPALINNFLCAYTEEVPGGACDCETGEIYDLNLTCGGDCWEDLDEDGTSMWTRGIGSFARSKGF